MIMRHTNRMWPHWFGVHSEKRDCDKGAISSESQYSVAELHRGMVLFSISLVEVNI